LGFTVPRIYGLVQDRPKIRALTDGPMVSSPYPQGGPRDVDLDADADDDDYDDDDGDDK
jgi:hypothetical protein